MFESSSIVYPIVAGLAALIGIMLIKTMFRKEHHLGHHKIRKLSNSRLGAYYYNSRSLVLTLAILAVAFYTAWQLWSISNGYAPSLKPFFIVFGSLFLAQLVAASFQKPIAVTSHSDDIKRFRPIVVIPVYNESPGSLRENLESYFDQTVMPAEVHVVDDGSDLSYEDVRIWFETSAKKSGIHVTWTKQSNAGKRSAHVTALKYATLTDNTIVITVDSDGVLDKHAIEEGLKPFVDPTVKSVGGLVLAKNAQQNLLARITDSLFVSSQQLIDRSSTSQFKSVIVNSGGLALYRADVISKSIEHGYANEDFFGRNVSFSDDSYLTLFSLIEGHTVQQPSAIVFADMPVNFSHHIRQQLRWARGSFIRGWWRLRHLPIGSFGFLRQTLGWLVFVTFLVVMAQILIFIPMQTGKLPPIEILVIPVIFSYLQASRYLSVKRSDMSFASQMFTFAISPLCMLWSLLILRPIRVYGAITCLNTGWGTRSKVEILHHSDEEHIR